MRRSGGRRLTLAGIAALGLVLSFPPVDLGFLAWVGLIPLLLALKGLSAGRAFCLAYATGVLFFSGIFYWLGHVTIVGAVLLILYLALYIGVFGWIWTRWASLPLLWQGVGMSSVWVVLEFLRGHLLSGFPWGYLGHTQHRFLPLIQIAEVTGVAGVSFLIVWVNVTLYHLLTARRWRREFVVPLVVLACVGLYGGARLRRLEDSAGRGGSLRVAVIQANVPQDLKWNPRSWPDILRRYAAWTRQAAAENPDLIVWPETAFPGFLIFPGQRKTRYTLDELASWMPDGTDDTVFWARVKALARDVRIPILLGTVVRQGDRYYNAAVLLKGNTVERYDKVHLVPFGEYIPFRWRFPFLADIIPIADFSAGREAKVFQMEKGAFSTMICFEDTISERARPLVSAGADFLVNMTNDAWFGESAAPFMHLQSAVFRSVEARRFLVRAANTGISAFIAPSGAVSGTVARDGRRIFIDGYAIRQVWPRREMTFYTKYGDVFTFWCFGCILGMFFLKRRRI